MPDRYAVIGNPIGHSKSPQIHSKFAELAGHEIEYGVIAGELGGFRDAAEAFRLAGGRGMNVTAPFKVDAFDYATDPSEQARLAGAVNALKFDDGKICAENFDGVGLTRDIVHNLNFPMAGRRVLLLGAGGAARGAMRPFLAQRPGLLLVVNRTVGKAKALVDEFSAFASGELAFCSYPETADMAQPFDIVVNATSASLRGELPPVHTHVFAPRGLAYELAYGKGLTPFLRLAQGAGAGRLADGVGMLVEQAAEAFAWWRGVRPETQALISALTVPLI